MDLASKSAISTPTSCSMDIKIFLFFSFFATFGMKNETVLSQDHHQKAIVLMILLFRTFDSFGV